MPVRPGLLHLVLPHPALDSPGPAPTPRTPRRTPGESTRTSTVSDKPRSSIDSWNSVDTNELIWEWKDDELELLSRTLDNIPSHLMTPYVGVVPPPNVLDKLARNVALSRNAIEWPHSVRATRVKLHELCRRKTVQKAIERHAPRFRSDTQNSPQVPEAQPPVRRPLYRQSSMDFLPVKNEPISVTRLASRLQRTDRPALYSSFHPYARPSESRGSTPPPTTDVPTRPRTRSITSSETSGRSPTPRRLFRSSATPPPEPPKRAPSFSARSIRSRAQPSRSSAPPEGQSSSDEEEKARQAQTKRPRLIARRVPSFLGTPLLAPSPEEGILDPLVAVPEDTLFAPTISSKNKQVPRKSTKSTSKPAIVISASETPAATPRTLRRVGTRTLPCPAPATSAPVATAPAAPRSTVPRTAIGHLPRGAVPNPPAPVLVVTDEERRRERRERKERRERGKDTQPAPSTRRTTKASREPVPSVAPMRL